MIKKHIVLIGILLAFILFLIAAYHYPGGSQRDVHSGGYDWMSNYLCNLFSARAINGAASGSPVWAIAGMFFLCSSLALFFFRFARKIDAVRPANIIRYCGAAAMFFTFWVFTPLHDMMTSLASICGLLALFYILVFVYRSKRLLFKILMTLSLLVLYVNNYIYYTQQGLAILPVMQKVSFLLIVVTVLGLDYFTDREDFIGPKKQVPSFGEKAIN